MDVANLALLLLMREKVYNQGSKKKKQKGENTGNIAVKLWLEKDQI